MLALIIITGILLYAFIVIVLFNVTDVYLQKRHGCWEKNYCSYDHEFTAGFLAAFWPVSYILTGLAIGLYTAGVAASNWVLDKIT